MTNATNTAPTPSTAHAIKKESWYHTGMPGTPGGKPVKGRPTNKTNTAADAKGSKKSVFIINFKNFAILLKIIKIYPVNKNERYVIFLA